MTPQYIYINEFGSKYYFKDKKMNIRHREDGPAIDYSDGNKVWYLNGVSYTETEFNYKTAKEIVLTMDEIADKFGIDVSKLKIEK
jgi:hypothetical protein